MEGGTPIPFHRESVIAIMSRDEVALTVKLGVGETHRDCVGAANSRKSTWCSTAPTPRSGRHARRALMEADSPIILIKIGGSTLGSEDTSFDDVAAFAAAGRASPSSCMAAAPQSRPWMAKLGIRAEFVRGLRVTDGPSLEVATAVLAGLINKQLVSEMRSLGVNAVGISGADGGLLRGAHHRPGVGVRGGRTGGRRVAHRTLDGRRLRAGRFAGCVERG